MDITKAVILGIIQGLTEFLPISSSGHLVIGSEILNFQAPGIAFEVALHLGSLVAVLLAFRHELSLMVRALFVSAPVRRQDSELSRMFLWNIYVIVATLPAVVVGLFFKDSIERIFDNILVTFSMLAVTGTIMLLTRLIPDKSMSVSCPRALLIGTAQAIAILPGLSRSGSTIFAGMLQGINRETAARFSFIMSIPAIIGAAVLKLGDLVKTPPVRQDLLSIGAGTLAAAISSTCRNSRIGVPLPQTTTSSASSCTASWKRRSNAGITWLFSGWKLSFGP